jgi:uncharacterized protein with PCYCGC motif
VTERRLPWVIAGVAGVALVALLVVTQTGGGGAGGPGGAGGAASHPDPRPDVTADRVLPQSLVRNTPGAVQAYAAARNAPRLLDGLYCHCECAKNFGHRSLLTCFESDHGSQCDICMGEATLAAQLAAQGNSLTQIRQAIDQRFGS